MKQIDTQGLSCPEPVIRACRAVHELSTGEKVEILVETGAARENVLRAVRNLGCEADAVEHESNFRIIVIKH